MCHPVSPCPEFLFSMFLFLIKEPQKSNLTGLPMFRRHNLTTFVVRTRISTYGTNDFISPAWLCPKNGSLGQIPKGMDANVEERREKCQRRDLGSRQSQVVPAPGGGGSLSSTQVLKPARDRRHGDVGILEPPPLTATRFRCVGAF